MFTVRKLPRTLRRGDLIKLRERDVRLVTNSPVSSPYDVHVELRSGGFAYVHAFPKHELVEVVVGNVERLQTPKFVDETLEILPLDKAS